MSLDAGPSLYDAAMGTDSKPEAWQTSAHGPWSTLDNGVAIETVPGQRGMHRVTWPIEVVSDYAKGDKEVETAEKQVSRLIREAARYEYVLLGVHEITGKLPLPHPR
jgi:hypothetical protein